MHPRAIIAIVVALVIVLLASTSLYIVPATHRGVLLEFGQVKQGNIKAGLHFKYPFIDKVRQYDVRVLTLDLPVHQYLTVEQKPLNVDSYVAWQIQNVAQFYRATNGDELNAVRLLTSRVDNGLRNEFGVRTMHQVVSGERDELLAHLTKQVDKLARKNFGIRILDIRIKAIDLSKRVSANVFKRMRFERQKEAQEHRSKGKELAEGIKADADRKRTVILADAYRKSESLRGEGDQTASRIYAKAFNKDPEFYRFYRSLEAYRKAFANKHDVLVVDGNSNFMQYLNNPKGAAAKH